MEKPKRTQFEELLEQYDSLGTEINALNSKKKAVKNQIEDTIRKHLEIQRANLPNLEDRIVYGCTNLKQTWSIKLSVRHTKKMTKEGEATLRRLQEKNPVIDMIIDKESEVITIREILTPEMIS